MPADFNVGSKKMTARKHSDVPVSPPADALDRTNAASIRAVIGAAAIVLALGVSGPVEALAQQAPTQVSQTLSQTAPPAGGSLWSFRVSPYFWMTSLKGDVGVGKRLPPAKVDIDFNQIFDAIDWSHPPVMLSGEVRYDRFAFVTDFIDVKLEDSQSPTIGPVSLKTDATLTLAIWTFGGSYRLLQQGPATLDVMAGGRLWNLDGTLKLKGPRRGRNFSGNQTWVDPIVGVSGRVDLGSGFALQAEGDVGGFGVGADSDWQVVGALQYQVSNWLSLDAGYRYLTVNYSNGGFRLDASMSGPIIGASFRF
jgi:hypothetical protein